MDQGDAAVLAAAITAGIGAIGAACAYAAGRAQARGMVEGVKLQLRGDREAVVWLAQRDASAGFLTAIDLFQASLIHAQSLIRLHLEEQTVTGEEVDSGVATAKQHYKELIQARATMRLSVGGDDLDSAEDLTNDATEFLERFLAYQADPHPHQGYNTPLYLRMERAEVRLRNGVDAWTRQARQRLSESQVARTFRP